MAGRSDYSQSWMKLSTSYYQDPKMMRISLPAETLFTRMLALAKHTASGGLIHESQLVLISHKIRNVRAYVDELVRVGLLGAARPEHDGDTKLHGGDTTGARREHDGDTTAASWRIDGYTKWYGGDMAATPPDLTATRDPSISAGQDAASRARPRERPPAREREKEREKEDSVRSSGTERTESARAAPLAGGAATRHAQLMDIRAPWDPPDEPDRVEPDVSAAGPSAQNRERIQKALAQGYSGSGSKGKPTTMWKYPRTLNSYDPENIPQRKTPENAEPDDRPVLADIMAALEQMGISREKQLPAAGDAE